jgi:hypothetical protein
MATENQPKHFVRDPAVQSTSLASHFTRLLDFVPESCPVSSATDARPESKVEGLPSQHYGLMQTSCSSLLQAAHEHEVQMATTVYWCLCIGTYHGLNDTTTESWAMPSKNGSAALPPLGLSLLNDRYSKGKFIPVCHIVDSGQPARHVYNSLHNEVPNLSQLNPYLPEIWPVSWGMLPAPFCQRSVPLPRRLVHRRIFGPVVNVVRADTADDGVSDFVWHDMHERLLASGNEVQHHCQSKDIVLKADLVAVVALWGGVVGGAAGRGLQPHAALHIHGVACCSQREAKVTDLHLRKARPAKCGHASQATSSHDGMSGCHVSSSIAVRKVQMQ